MVLAVSAGDRVRVCECMEKYVRGAEEEEDGKHEKHKIEERSPGVSEREKGKKARTADIKS